MFNRVLFEKYRLQSTIGLLCFGVFILEYLFGWFYLRGERVGFGDLKYILDCSRELNLKAYFTHGSCPEYMYGVTWLHFSQIFKIYAVPIPLIMFSIFAIYSIFTGYLTVFTKKSVAYSVLLLLIPMLFSPPVSLLFERGNLDGVIFEMVFASAILATRGMYKSSIILLIFTTLFKFYTFPLLAGELFILSTFKRVNKAFALVLVLFVGLIVFKDYSMVEHFPWDARNMFGAPIFMEYFYFVFFGPHTHANKSLAIVTGVIFAVLIIWILDKNGLKEFHPNIKHFDEAGKSYTSVYMFMLAVFIPMFFVGLSIDYRLIFILVPQIMYTFMTKSNLKFFGFNLLLLFLTTFLSYNTYLLQPIGDFAAIMIVAIQIHFLVINRKTLAISIVYKPKSLD